MRNALLIAITGHGARTEGRRVPEGDFDLHLIKPVDPEDLAAILSGCDHHAAR